MNIYRLSLFFTPISFRWTIPLIVLFKKGETQEFFHYFRGVSNDNVNNDTAQSDCTDNSKLGNKLSNI
jgi:hypothetical protein